MNLSGKPRHTLQILFPIILFAVFTLSALTLVLLSANVYRSTTEHSFLNDASRTCLSYISEKVHQYDTGNAVAVGSLEGQDALILGQQVGDTRYETYIYAYDGSLRELFVKAGTPVALSAGKAILQIDAFDLEQLPNGLLRFSCTDSAGNAASILLSLHSAGRWQ